MSFWMWIVALFAVCAAGGWLFRCVGQKLTGNAPRFRDMPFGDTIA